MSQELIDVPKQAIADARPRFLRTAVTNEVDWEAESLFAYSICANNDYLWEIATRNPWSLTMAMVNVAAIGVTLNPARQFAYLVPRDGRVVVDIGYRGLIHVATKEGSILWAKAEIVREKDLANFEYRGVNREPHHPFNPFDKERGEIVGAYSLAGLPNGTVLCEAVSIEEIWQARDRSAYYRKTQSGPWVDDTSEMIKKTTIKRGAKTWPNPGPRMAAAIDYLNREAGEGLAISDDLQPSTIVDEPTIVRTEGVPERMRRYLDRLIARTLETGLWDNARELIAERYQGPYKTWALQELQAAEDRAKTVAQA